jgi:hypothetical protein
MGYITKANQTSATAMGQNTIASGIASTAMGYQTNASGDYSTAMGQGTTATGDRATAMGYQTNASGDYSTAMGESTTASGTASTAMGLGTTASGTQSTAMGSNTHASKPYSTAIGTDTHSDGTYSTTMGSRIIASGSGSFGIGLYNTVISNKPNITQNKTLAIMGGKVGIGTVAPNATLHVALNDTPTDPTWDKNKDVAIFENSGDSTVVQILSDANNNGVLAFSNPSQRNKGTITYDHNFGILKLAANYTGGDKVTLSLNKEGNVGIGTLAPESSLDIKGSIGVTYGYLFYGNNDLGDGSLYFCNANAGQVNISLPSTAAASGRVYIIKKTDSTTNKCVIKPQTDYDIEALTSYNLTTQYQYVTIVNNGLDWYVIGEG